LGRGLALVRRAKLPGFYLKEINKAVTILVINTGGYQQATFIRSAIENELIDAVAIARPLIANNDRLHQWEEGKDLPDRPSTYCNKCLKNAPKNPLGCYELDRFYGDYNKMIKEIMSVFYHLPDFKPGPSHIDE